MAKVENISLDTRTFPQICLGISKKDWLDLRTDILAKTGKTEQSVLNWRKGKIPMSILERKSISDCVNRILKLNTRYWFLFPEEEA